MKVFDLDVGDRVWLYGADPTPKFKFKWLPYPRFVRCYSKNELVEGTVVLEFQRQGTKYYVISVMIPVILEEALHVRTGWMVTDSPDKPLGIFRNAKRTP